MKAFGSKQAVLVSKIPEKFRVCSALGSKGSSDSIESGSDASKLSNHVAINPSWKRCLPEIKDFGIIVPNKFESTVANKPFSFTDIQSHSYSTVSTQSTSKSFMNLPLCDSINLVPLIKDNIFQTIKSLPEVEQLLSVLQGKTSNNSKSILIGLDRAIQIFQHVGISEYKAMLLLKATYLSQLCQYHEAIKVLLSLLSFDEGEGHNSVDDNKYIIMSSLVKMNWYNGSFDMGLEHAHTMTNMISPSTTSPQSKLYQGCTMNARSLCKLLSLNIKDADIQRLKNYKKNNNHEDQIQKQKRELDDIRCSLFAASKLLEDAYIEAKNSPNYDDTNQQICLAISCASSYCNQGIVDFIATIGFNQEQSADHCSYVSSMTTWKLGLDILDGLELQQEWNTSTNPSHVYVCKITKARIYSNMAWLILFHSSYLNGQTKDQPIKVDQLKIASEYARLSLQLCDEITVMEKDHVSVGSHAVKHMMGRSLNLVAMCYARAGSAVTAEGLLKSAIDLFRELTSHEMKQNPFVLLNYRSSCLYYSSLCRNWEKRQSDANSYANTALEINNNMMSENWRDICGLFSGLCFFTSYDFTS